MNVDNNIQIAQVLQVYGGGKNRLRVTTTATAESAESHDDGRAMTRGRDEADHGIGGTGVIYAAAGRRATVGNALGARDNAAAEENMGTHARCSLERTGPAAVRLRRRQVLLPSL